MREIGNKLVRLRREKGINQADVRDGIIELGLTQKTKLFHIVPGFEKGRGYLKKAIEGLSPNYDILMAYIAYTKPTEAQINELEQLIKKEKPMFAICDSKIEEYRNYFYGNLPRNETNIQPQETQSIDTLAN